MQNGEKKSGDKDSADKESLKEILAYIEKTDLEVVQIEKDGRKISLKRSAVSAPAPADKPAEKEKEEPKIFVIRSPIVGRFHSSMGADRPALVVEGGNVTAGQRVAIVEAMKIKKEVFSAATGKVVRIHVRDGDPVEYGQELFSVEPESQE